MLQMFLLMDRLLKRENLDLKLTPYRCIQPLLLPDVQLMRFCAVTVMGPCPCCRRTTLRVLDTSKARCRPVTAGWCLTVLLICRVLPTSATDGMIEYVPSVSLAHVLAEHRTITRFLHIHHPDASGTALLHGANACACCWLTYPMCRAALHARACCWLTQAAFRAAAHLRSSCWSR